MKGVPLVAVGFSPKEGVGLGLKRLWWWSSGAVKKSFHFFKSRLFKALVRERNQQPTHFQNLQLTKSVKGVIYLRGRHGDDGVILQQLLCWSPAVD